MAKEDMNMDIFKTYDYEMYRILSKNYIKRTVRRKKTR